VSAPDWPDRVRAAQRRVDAGHGTDADVRLLALDRRRWYGGACAGEAGIDAYGERVLPVIGSAR
jgi:hypothetical protein